MSLPEFQRAIAELVASPQRCVRARDDFEAETLRFALTERERRRLHAMLNESAMSVNCMLYRVNRMAPLISALPLTCSHLGAAFEAELNEFWRTHPDAIPQYGAEARRFGVWLEQRVSNGDLPGGPFLDALHFELAVFDLTVADEDGGRLVRFDYDPRFVLYTPAQVDQLPSPMWVLLEYHDGDIVATVSEAA
jgi:hypothetical protein